MTTKARPANPFVRMISLLRTGPKPILMRFYDQITRRRTGAPIWEVTQITDQIFVGGQHYPQGWHKMEAKGITAVVNMRESWHDDVKMGVGGQRHLHLITRDNTPPAIEDLQKGVDFITEEVNRGGKVYIHCGVGVGRAPSMAAAYFISLGMTTDEAMQKIKKVRPFVHPTPSQRRQLEAYAETVQ